MEKIKLGKSGVEVSRLCFGSLTVGPLQAALPIEEGAFVIAHALERGVNFIDTAQYYENYEYIRRAMEISRRYDTVISTKTYAYNRPLAQAAFDEARRALNRDYIDIFMLHEQESIHTLRGHMEALDYMLELRTQGLVRAVGASMHHIAAVDGVCALAPTRELDVIHPIYNMSGLGIVDGTKDEMLAAIKRARAAGIGVFAMKPLGGGNLYMHAAQALRYVLDSGAAHSVAVGMRSVDEVDANIEFFESGKFPPSYYERNMQASGRKRKLHIEEYCEGCGRCVDRCGQNALRLDAGRAVCDPDTCLLCGYCSAVCPMFAIKII